MQSKHLGMHVGISVLLLILFAGSATAAPVEIQFVRETSSGSSTLESVGFDGTSFTSGATSLETINPTWTAMSYDPFADLMYFVRETSSGSSILESVGFDGTSFTSGATFLETINPTWTAMSVVRDQTGPGPGPTPVPTPGTISLLLAGLALLGFSRRRLVRNGR